MSYADHQHDAQGITPRCAIVTLSDTRTPETDTSGQLIWQLLVEAGAVVERQHLLRDDAGPFRTLMDELLADPAIQCIITTGGTGITRRDQAINVTAALLDTPLPGFGELFRMLSFEEIGSGAMLSRAVGGVARGRLVFSLPGSRNAVHLALKRLILPEIRHLLKQLLS